MCGGKQVSPAAPGVCPFIDSRQPGGCQAECPVRQSCFHASAMPGQLILAGGVSCACRAHIADFPCFGQILHIVSLHIFPHLLWAGIKFSTTYIGTSAWR